LQSVSGFGYLEAWEEAVEWYREGFRFLLFDELQLLNPGKALGGEIENGPICWTLEPF